MFVGVLAGIAGQTMLFRSLTLAAYLALLALGFHMCITPYEKPTIG